MNKQEFLARLRQDLCGLPQEDREERITFYSEMIDDRMEEGLSEEDAVAAVDTLEEPAAEALQNISPRTETDKPRRRRVPWEIALLVLGAPVWVPLLLAMAAVACSLYVSLWSVAVSLWSVFASFVACGACATALGIGFAIGGSVNVAAGLAMSGTGLILLGLAIFCFFGCRAASIGLVRLTKAAAAKIGIRLAKKEAV